MDFQFHKESDGKAFFSYVLPIYCILFTRMGDLFHKKTMLLVRILAQSSSSTRELVA